MQKGPLEKHWLVSGASFLVWWFHLLVFFFLLLKYSNSHFNQWHLYHCEHWQLAWSLFMAIIPAFHFQPCCFKMIDQNWSSFQKYVPSWRFSLLPLMELVYIIFFFFPKNQANSLHFFFFLNPVHSAHIPNLCSGWVGDPLPWTTLASLHPQVSVSCVLMCWFNPAGTDSSGSEDWAAQSRGWLWLLSTTALIGWAAKSKFTQTLQVWTERFWFCSRASELLAMAWLCCCPCLEGPLKTLC